ncbi:MAG: hypothetical protein U1E26_11620 [Coriobacteriia bacterium]|nr:hypothetical protein [Coriobacteriia bacterium]
MVRCIHIETCVFFNDRVGYSPELQESMREEFCVVANSGCARFIAMADMPRDEIPDDLIPTDLEQLERLRRARSGGGAD